jgi:hypothetical protein
MIPIGETKFLSVLAASKLLGMSYESVLMVAERGQDLRVDPETKLPVVSAGFVTGLRSFSCPARLCGPGVATDIPKADKSMMSTLQSVKTLTRGDYAYPFVSRKHMEVWKGFFFRPGTFLRPDFGEQGRGGTWFIMEMFGVGHWRYKTMGGAIMYYRSDLEDSDDWASPAELAWREVDLVLQDAIAMRPTFQDKAAKAKKVDKWRLLAKTQVEEVVKAPKPDHRAPRGEFPELPEDSVVRYDVEELPTRETSLFSFQDSFVKMPENPTQTGIWAASIPLPLLQEAQKQAATYWHSLFEHRTAASRAYGTLSTAQHRSIFQDSIQAIYDNRLAWQHGILAPLLQNARPLF